MFKMTKAILIIAFTLSFGCLPHSFLLSQDNKIDELPSNASFQYQDNGQTFNFQIIPKEKIKICLTMIVKNESQIIERCLNSAKNIIDCISICDTGSTDNTVEIIEQFMQKNKIPGKVHRHTWLNFGHNRTLSAQAAQQTLIDLNFPLPTTYLLLLDADMILEVDEQFRNQLFSSDAYSILQKNHFLSYYNTRLIRASLPWECVGVTHEYWACKQLAHTSQFQSLTIDDREDGGCKADKFERDIKLLTQGLKNEPDNERYMFYLAQTYKCLKNFPDAIRWYKARIAKDGWKEELFYSKFAIGEIYEEMNFWDQALHWYLDAYQTNPARAESLHKITSHYRINGETDLAYLFAKQGARIPYPKDQFLFIAHPVYDYQFDEEISVAAYYIPNAREEGFAAANRLVLKKGIPPYVKNQTYRNLSFYVQNIQNEEVKPIEFELPLIKVGRQERYYAINPSIQKTEDGYDVMCLAINKENVGEFNDNLSGDQNETLNTKCYLLHYDRNLKLLSQNEIIENLPRVRSKGVWGTGFEECRFIGLDDKQWFLATTQDTHPEMIGQSLCKLAKQPSGSFHHVEKLLPAKIVGKSPQFQRKWLPFVKDNEIYAIENYDPLIIYKINKENGNCETAFNYTPSYDFSRFQGAAAPIAFDDGYLVLIQEVVDSDEKMNFLHRFLYMDKKFNISKLSKPFTFMHTGIESSCGMTIDHTGTKCIVSMSYENQKAYFIVVNLDAIRSLLTPLP